LVFILDGRVDIIENYSNVKLKRIFSLTILVIICFVSFMGFNSAFADCGNAQDFPGVTACINFDSPDWYYSDHGAIVSVTRSNDQPNNGVPNETIQVIFGTNTDPYGFSWSCSPLTSGCGNTPLTFTEDGDTGNYYLSGGMIGSHVIPGYLTLTLGQTDRGNPSNCAGCYKDNIQKPALKTGTTDTIWVNFGGFVAARSITSADDSSSFPRTIPANQPQLRTVISCPTDQNTNSQDQDGDGICDAWEDQSTTAPAPSATPPIPAHSGSLYIPWTNNGVTSVYQYYCGSTPSDTTKPLGDRANPDPICPTPFKKDIFVEADYLKRHHPDVTTSLQAIKNSFNNAPVPIPTNCSPSACSAGVNLHVQVDEELPFHKDIMSIPSAGAPLVAGSTDFDMVKANYFGTQSDRTVCPPGTNSCGTYITNILTEKRQVFHYALYGHFQNDGTGSASTSSGASELPGNDMFITLGAFTGGVGSIDQQEGTFMHELGHNLGLYHGGEYPVLNPANDTYDNCKPNYPSVMSYSRQFSDLDPNRVLSYSNGVYSNIYYAPLGETGGLTEYPWFPTTYPNQQTLAWGVTDANGLVHIHTLISGSAFDWDWNNNGRVLTNELPSTMNVNNLGFHGCNTVSPDPNAMITLNDFNDWANLGYDMKTSTGWYDGTVSSGTTAVPLETGIQAGMSSHIIGHTIKKSMWHDGVYKEDVIKMRADRIYELDQFVQSLNSSTFHSGINKTALHNGLTLAKSFVTLDSLYSATNKLQDLRNKIVNSTIANSNMIDYHTINYNVTSPNMIYYNITNHPITNYTITNYNATNYSTKQELLAKFDSVIKSFLLASMPPEHYNETNFHKPIWYDANKITKFVQCNSGRTPLIFMQTGHSICVYPSTYGSLSAISVKGNPVWISPDKYIAPKITPPITITTPSITITPSTNTQPTCQQGYYYDAKTNTCLQATTIPPTTIPPVTIRPSP